MWRPSLFQLGAAPGNRIPTVTTMAELNPAQTASTGKTTGKYKYEVTKAIADSAGKTLLECIQAGIVEKPKAMSWNTWQQWRRTTSPKEETDGFRQESTIERGLHLAVMEALYGTLWESGLTSTEGSVSAIPSQPLYGRGATCSQPSGDAASAPGDGGNPEERGEASASSSTQRSPRREDGGGDILQEQDPWLGQSLPGSKPSTPPSAPTRTSLSPGSRPSIPPGLGEPRRSDFAAAEVPVPQEAPSSPRAKTTTEDDEVKLRSPQPMRASSNVDTPCLLYTSPSPRD